MSRTRHPLVALPALRPLALAACMAAAVPPVQSAQGQSQQAEATLPAVTVQARRSEEKAKDLPFTVNVIDDVALEQRRLSRLEDVIRDTPGASRKVMWPCAPACWGAGCATCREESRAGASSSAWGKTAHAARAIRKVAARAVCRPKWPPRPHENKTVIGDTAICQASLALFS